MTHIPNSTPADAADAVVHIRLIGCPEAVDRATARIAEALTASAPSHHQASRKNPSHVLVRFEVIA